MQNIFFHQLIDIHNEQIYPAKIVCEDGNIISIEKTNESCEGYILPGFIDAHVHVESSMLIPSEFARMAVMHGTVATVSDPHEIANVCGIEGIEYMLSNARKVPFKFFFGAPSCVPATSFETAGAIIDAEAIKLLLERDDIYYLSEMMNYPGVLFKDEEVIRKIDYAKSVGKPVDGHAPGLSGEDARHYIEAGISTDHECFTMEEALGKLKLGMKILIREGSAAKNFDALSPLIEEYSDKLMFCCDDKHPDEFVLHHINHHVKRALQQGHNLFHVLKIACKNPVLHYKLPVGLLRVQDDADFIVIDNLTDFNILKTYIRGELVASHGQCLINSVAEKSINKFNCQEKRVEDFQCVAPEGVTKIKVIEALEGQLITRTILMEPKKVNNFIVSDPEQDILKIAVVNRYNEAKPAIGFIKNFGLKKGAIASTVAHDSHNIICIGVEDESITQAVNELIYCHGGIAVVNEEFKMVLPLPVAGLMTTEPGEKVALAYSEIDKKAKEMGCTLKSPFMTMSFMALLVIPQLKLSDLGLFDGERFQFTELWDKEHN